MFGLNNAWKSNWNDDLKHGQKVRKRGKLSSKASDSKVFTHANVLGIITILLLYTFTLPAQSCSLNFTSPAAGATFLTPTITVTGTGSGTANPNDVGQVTATINGTVFFSQSGTFTTLINFLGSGAASVTLQPGANTLVVTGSVAGCSASDTRVIFYDPTPAATKKNQGPSPATCNGTNPINGGTSNKVQLETDYQGDGIYPLVFQRHYNSKATETSAVGKFWRSSFSDRLDITPTKISAERASGAAYQFLLQNGVWIPDADISLKLASLANGQWRLIQDDDTIETYNSSGKLISIQLRNGLGQTLSYDAVGRLSQVIDTFGKTLGFFYVSAAANANLDHIVLPDATEIHYAYLANGNLSQVIYADTTPLDLTDNPRKTYHYEEILFPSALTGITDENNARFATWHYDNLGRAISSEHATGGIDRYLLSYSADGSRTSITDPLGSVRTSHFTTVLGVVKPTGSDQPGGSGCNASASSLTYDANGNIASRTDFNGNRSCYAYDTSRNLETVRLEGLAPGSSCPADLVAYTPAANSSERKISTDWHATFRLPVKLTEPGLETTYSYNDQGQVTLTSLKDLNTLQTRSWSTSYTYSPAGILLSKVEDGPRTDVSDATTYDYYPEDAACTGGHFGCRGQLKQVTDALGHTTEISRYNAHSQPEEVIDPNGLVTTLVYDVRQRLTSLTVGSETTSYSYDPAGLITRVTGPDGAYLAYTYDDAHRLTGIQDQLGNTVTYTLDALGNRTQEDVRDPTGQLARSQSRVYDALSRLQNLVLPE
jgi:YD repeat-containing protein